MTPIDWPTVGPKLLEAARYGAAVLAGVINERPAVSYVGTAAGEAYAELMAAIAAAKGEDRE